ncbi:hypothetical protein [Paractinoplanes atraurantiacus]|uniref:Uncharacterized protein n=1 Tax=Paractinoplanes atraurantiacus TaxID=1036182 RepID=A0A285KK05_9ACTN|nr:hypothetical protein [Actinoplanes atraurantiacus]SNY72935.1 hypothetical protein SAMN05421748_14466 [Actinoplanes atraurantiacus]
MNPSITTPPETDTDDGPGRQSLLQALREAAGDRPLLARENWRLGVAGLAALAVLLVVLRLTWLLIAAFVDGLHAGGGTLGGWLQQHATIVQAVNDPVRSWLDSNTAGLPVTGGDLWLVWLTALSTIWPAALARSLYARIAWAALGALTAAVAYAGAPPGAGMAAAGLTGLLWLLLSLPVYGRLLPGKSLPRNRKRRAAPTLSTSFSREF